MVIPGIQLYSGGLGRWALWGLATLHLLPAHTPPAAPAHPQAGRHARAEATRYPFIQYDQNAIENADRGLVRFPSRLRRLRAGELRQAHVVHIGDSHIQADLFTGEVRRLLQAQFGSAGRGFIVPYQLAHTNSPDDLRTASNVAWTHKRCVFPEREGPPIGVGGITLRTHQPDWWLRIELREDAWADFDKLTLFCDKGPDCENFRLSERTSGEPSAPLAFRDLEYVDNTLGDGPGATRIWLSEPVRTLYLRGHRVDSAQQHTTLYGIQLENSRQVGIQYTAIGVNGAMYAHYNKAAHFLTQLAQLEPDLVIVSLGTNESMHRDFSPAEFRSQIDALVQNLLAFVPNADLLLTTPNDTYRGRKYHNPSGQAAAEVIRAYAEEQQLAYWDFFGIMGGYGAIQQWYANGLAQADRVHLSRSGYRLQGQLLYEALTQGVE